ncbi:class I SAM-dependent DNA methyltransferase [Plantactinospora endophytica]|uniref:Methyltransferase n=1 Tax=Plantactinospora endophytica TaxID=673535 RepID=A0ABQ4E9H9_9ACTN|nr:class I SAM-dependent methyltransferase [Plantactinospora endophytica]GIG91348.1 methyltransferase [Plantactinospora endophytica]
MTVQGWLADTRTSYDTVAERYADMFRHALDDAPYDRAILTLFADLVRRTGDGPVADVGCGTGRITAYLTGLGLDVFGIDLSPGMIDIARRDHPALRFEVRSMTDLDLPDAALAGLLAWWSLIHVPDEAIPAVLAQFRRVLRPGAPLLLGFFAGDESRLRTEGYGGHPMRVYVHRRPPERVAAWLHDAGFTVEARMVLDTEKPSTGAILIAR